MFAFVMMMILTFLYLIINLLSSIEVIVDTIRNKRKRKIFLIKIAIVAIVGLIGYLIRDYNPFIGIIGVIITWVLLFNRFVFRNTWRRK